MDPVKPSIVQQQQLSQFGRALFDERFVMNLGLDPISLRKSERKAKEGNVITFKRMEREYRCSSRFIGRINYLYTI